MAEILKVTPEKLLEASNEFSTTGKTVSSLTQEMLEIINSLKSIWQGEAANSYFTKFMGLQDDIEKINKMIQEHVTDLAEMSNEYRIAEETNIEASSSLLSDVVA